MEEKKEGKIEVQISQEVMKGVYSNVVTISHTKEEFLLDFLFLQQQPTPFGALVSRVILSPPHAKRLLISLEKNIRKYEEKFGEILVSPTEESIIQ